MEEKTLEQLIKEALEMKNNKAFIKTNMAVFYGFTVTQINTDYIFGFPSEEIRNKEDKLFWRIPKNAILDICFADYSQINLEEQSMEAIKIKEINVEKKTIIFINRASINQLGTNTDRHFHQHRYFQIGIEKSPFYVIDATFNLNNEANYLLWEPKGNHFFILKTTEFNTKFKILKL